MEILYWLSDKIGLCLYLFFLYKVWHMCQYGIGWGELYDLVPVGLGIILCFVLWLISWKLAEDERDPAVKKKILLTEILIAASWTVIFGVKIIDTAIPYHGALSWRLAGWIRQKEIKLVHDNFFDFGVSGILQDLDREVELPEELYITDDFQLRFDERGKIHFINTFLYGRDERGRTRTYQIFYASDAGENITVLVDEEENMTYSEDMRLEPMLRILQAAGEKDQIRTWCGEHRKKGELSASDRAGEYTFTEYEILYYGRRSFTKMEGLVYLPGDVDGDGVDSGRNEIGKLKDYGEITGFEVSLHCPEQEEIIPARYIMEPEYTSQEQLNDEQEMQQIEAAIDAETWTVDSSDGTMYFFLNENKGWKLVVLDAASGSRFYGLEKTEDGGRTWNEANGNPFDSMPGVAEGLVFFDENTGFAGLSGASQSHSQLFVTKDGGASFTKIQLPVDQVMELPEHAAEYGFTVEDYDYLYLPEREGNVLTVRAVTEAGETEGLLFRSEDEGETWEYIEDSL